MSPFVVVSPFIWMLRVLGQNIYNKDFISYNYSIIPITDYILPGTYFGFHLDPNGYFSFSVDQICLWY